MKSIEQILAGILEGVIACAFLAIFILVVIQVFLRYVLNSAIPGANEVVIILFVYTTALGGALAAGRGEHIALTFATDLLPEAIRKVMARISFLLVAWINGVMVWFSLHWIGVTGDYLMPSTGLTRSVTQISIPFGCGLAGIYCLLKAVAPLDPQPDAQS
jgi:TRAP-type C4-dicarboxylate transport system permease small subunit|tara:strand:+ start:10400 stop:10879 length:480 start_codon:yes stop_codon:yes gene_type:complete